ncbi:MAG TPA: helix-turn-helix domain-containing protein [Candidatus Angelobacter sp.]|nr:helix-turn-helix domain-containing protein [Candidatus Angelobacter sp.]
MSDARNGKRNILPVLVDTVEAARILGRSPATLKRWRHEGIGPNFIQIHNRVRYDVDVLRAFIEEHIRVGSVRAALETSREAV